MGILAVRKLNKLLTLVEMSLQNVDSISILKTTRNCYLLIVTVNQKKKKKKLRYFFTTTGFYDNIIVAKQCME